MRPPGHHATASRAMGFCYLNSIAIAAHHALECRVRTRCHLGFRRTPWQWNRRNRLWRQSNTVCLDSPASLLSGHRERVSQETSSIGRSRREATPERHASAVRQALDRLVEFDPGIVLVSAGFDAYAGDPLTEMTLEHEHFANFGRWLKETGLAGAPILEGGYSNDLATFSGSVPGRLERLDVHRSTFAFDVRTRAGTFLAERCTRQ